MHRQDSGPPIVYSNHIEDAIKFINEVKLKYRECGDYIDWARDATQDLLHTMELCVATVQERNKVYTQMQEIRRKRRVAKNEQAVLSPIMNWIQEHEKDIKSLEQLLGAVRRAEDNTNGAKYYRSRTDVVEKLFGIETTVLDIPLEGLQPSESSEITKEEIFQDIVQDIMDSGEEDEELTEAEEDLNPDELIETTLEYPVVVYYCKKKKAGTYYYLFPGLEKSSTPHAFQSGDPAMNLNNKKLIHDMSVQLNEVMLKYKNGAPIPWRREDVNPQELKHGMRLGSISGTRVITMEFRCKAWKSELEKHFLL